MKSCFSKYVNSSSTCYDCQEEADCIKSTYKLEEITGVNRITKSEYYLGIAKAVSIRSTCLRRKYGCVIVKNDEIIATGYNGSARGEENCCDDHRQKCQREDKPHNSGDYSDCCSVHAEQNAMISASRRDMLGATMYLFGQEINGVEIKNCEPCPICSRMIKNSGIINVVNSSGYVKLK